MKSYILAALAAMSLVASNDKESKWQLTNTIDTEDVSLVGETKQNEDVWLEDKKDLILEQNNDETIASDFYSDRNWASIKKNGKQQKRRKGAEAPVEVQITKYGILVADGYTNEVEIFDKKGHFIDGLKMQEQINV
jgi:hypothetical protein